MKHYNPSIAEDKTRILNLKGQMDTSECLEYLTPTIEIKPRMNYHAYNSGTATGALTITTFPSDKDVYITDIQVSLIKDAVCDQATGDMSVTMSIDGVTRNVIRFPIITLTAQSIRIDKSLTTPIKVTRGTNCSFSASFTAGVMARSCVIMGYSVETIKGV